MKLIPRSSQTAGLREKRCFPGGSMVKNLPANAGSVGLIPGLGSSLEKEMATHSSILAWRILWTEEPGGLQSMGLQESDTTCHYLSFVPAQFRAEVLSPTVLSGFLLWHFRWGGRQLLQLRCLPIHDCFPLAFCTPPWDLSSNPPCPLLHVCLLCPVEPDTYLAHMSLPFP